LKLTLNRVDVDMLNALEMARSHCRIKRKW